MRAPLDTTSPGIAVVGCGHWGANHLRVWNTLGCLRVACDTETARRETVTARYPGVDVTADLEAVCANPAVGAVVVATPASTHLSVALRCLEAGKDVLVEKPLALSVAEGEQLVTTARHHGRILMVGHVLEYHPAVVKLKQLVDDGSLGRVRYVYANRVNLGRIRTEENALWSFAPHDIAIMVRLVETLPDTVACHGGAYLNQDVADLTLTSLQFPGNVRGHIFVSWLHPFKDHRLVVVGDRQMAVFDDMRPASERLLLYPHRVDWLGGQVPVAHKAEGVPVELDAVEPLLAECEHFLDCVRTRRPPLSDGESGLKVLRVLEAAQRSLERGGQPERLVAGDTREARYYAHPTATVDAEAHVGERTRIWHYSHVMNGATLGRDCVLGQNVFVGKNVRIGDGVKIQNNVSVYEGVELEDHVFCGPSAVFTNVINPRSEIERKEEFRRTVVRRGATLGANCTILCGVTIGRYAFVAAGAVVTKDVPDHALVVGAPSRVTGFMCRCGVRLRFEGASAKCVTCGTRYHRPRADAIEPEDP